MTEDDFIVGYCGNLGRAHEIDTVLDACRRLKDQPRIKFLFVGGGRLHARLAQAQCAHQLGNLVTRPYQPKHRLSAVLGLPDVHWMSLKPSLEGRVFPSKLYGIAAAGRPVLMIGDVEGSAARCVRRHEFGLAFEPGQGAPLAQAILALSEDRARLDVMGQAARRFVEVHASRAEALGLWIRLLDRLDGAQIA